MLISGLQLGITERLSCLCSLAHQPAHSASVLTLNLSAQGLGGAGNFIRPLRSGFVLRIGRAVNRVCFECFYSERAGQSDTGRHALYLLSC